MAFNLIEVDDSMGFLAALGGAMACAWGALLVLRGPLVFLGTLYLVVGAVVGFEWLHFDVAGTTMSLDRLLLLTIIAGFFVQRKLGRTAPKKLTAPEFVLLAFLAILLSSTFLHDWRRIAQDQRPILPHLLEGYLIPILLYGVLRGSRLDPRSLLHVYRLLALFGIYLAITAIFEVAGAWSLVYPRYISNPLIGIHFGRARGPFLQSVRLGMYLVTALAVTWTTLVWQSRRGKGGQLVGLGLAGLFGIAAFLTYTRSIWLAVLLGAAIVTAWTFRGGYRRSILFGMVALVLVAVPLKESFLTIKREYRAQDTVESTKMRAVFAYVSWLMFKDHPLAGVGFGHFPHVKESYLNDRQTSLRLGSIQGYVHHNSWLSLLVELGLPGLILYSVLMGLWGWQSWGLWHAVATPQWMRAHALITMIVLMTSAIQMLFHDVSYSPFENGILFVTTGINSALCQMEGLVPWRRQGLYEDRCGKSSTRVISPWLPDSNRAWR